MAGRSAGAHSRGLRTLCQRQASDGPSAETVASKRAPAGEDAFTCGDSVGAIEAIYTPITDGQSNVQDDRSLL